MDSVSLSVIPTNHDFDSGSLANPKMFDFLEILFYYKVIFIFYCLIFVFFSVNKKSKWRATGLSAGS